MGWFVRQYGLTIDHIRAVEVVLPTGAIVRATAEVEPELFRQVRGAGASVGIVVWFEIEAIELSTIGFAQIVVEADAAGETLLRWGRYMESAPRELTTINMLGRNGNGFAMSMMAVVASADERLIRRAIEPLLGVGTRLLDQQAQLAPYAALVPAGHHPHLGRQSAAMTNGLLPQVTSENARAIMTAAADDHGPLIQLRSLGGAVNDVAPDATAYPHRHQQALVLALVFPPLGDEQLDRVWSEISPHTEGSYRNFESRPTPETSHLLEASGGVPLR
jgi:hypothetical protein